MRCYNSADITDDDLIVTQKNGTSKTGAVKSLEDDAPGLNIDCKNSVYTEMTGKIEQLKTENESLSSIGITSVVQDSDAERTNFDIQITSDQIDTIASEAEPDDSSASESCSAANKSIFSKKPIVQLQVRRNIKQFNAQTVSLYMNTSSSKQDCMS